MLPNKMRMYGPTSLKGSVEISGAKNSALPILAATLLSSGWNKITNVPHLKDTETIVTLLRSLGAEVEHEKHQVSVNSDSTNNLVAPYDLVKTMRASILVLGPLLARFKKVTVSYPGGCALGERAINLHLSGLEKLGAKIRLEKGYVVAEAKHLRGATITFDLVTVTGTENLMMASALAKGTTILQNAAREPEIIDLANYLNSMGAKIEGAGTETIVVKGVSELKSASYKVMPDRIEAGTFLIAACAAGGDVEIKNCVPRHLDKIVETLQSESTKITATKSSIRIHASGEIQSIDIRTEPYPGLATDLQPQMMALMTQAQGRSTITETIFENRFNQAPELRRMGADIRVRGQRAFVRGPSKLTGAPVMATDIRASAALVIAGLVAEGKTEISRIYHLDRGYENMHKKLLKLGARIER